MKLWPFNLFETKSQSDADLAEMLGIGGPSVTFEQAISDATVQSCLRALMDSASTLSIKVVKVEDDGTETDQPTHPVALLLQGDVNDWTAGRDLIAGLMFDTLTRDAGGFAWVNRAGDGTIREIIRYRQCMINAAYEDTGEPVYRLGERVLSTGDVIHLRSPFDKAPLSLAMRTITAAYHQQRHATNLFRRGARPGGTIEVPPGTGEDAVKKIRSGWVAAHEGSDNGGRTALLYNGAKFSPSTFSSVDAQFLECRRFEVLEICRAFRVPPSMVYELERATWSNSEQMGREFLSYSLEPWLQALESCLRRALFTSDERKTLKIVFDRDDLTRASLSDRAIAINSLRASKVLNANEARGWLGLQPYDGGNIFENTNITKAEPSDGSS